MEQPRADTELPDEWRIDLDPMPDADYAAVRRVAHVVHEVLDELGAVASRRPRAATGCTSNVRIRPEHGFGDVRRGALAFAREVERRSADVTTTWWRKDRDPRAVFVDYNQNARDHTIAAAYSVARQRRGHGVDPDPLGRGRRRATRATSPSPRCRPVSPSSATCTRRHRHTEVFDLRPLLEWADRDERAGADVPPEPED